MNWPPELKSKQEPYENKYDQMNDLIDYGEHDHRIFVHVEESNHIVAKDNFKHKNDTQ